MERFWFWLDFRDACLIKTKWIIIFNFFFPAPWNKLEKWSLRNHPAYCGEFVHTFKKFCQPFLPFLSISLHIFVFYWELLIIWNKIVTKHYWSHPPKWFSPSDKKISKLKIDWLVIIFVSCLVFHTYPRSTITISTTTRTSDITKKIRHVSTKSNIIPYLTAGIWIA